MRSNLNCGLSSGYAAATVLAGVRAANVGIIGGATTGVGIFFAMGAFEDWRLRTGRAMMEVLTSTRLPWLRVSAMRFHQSAS